jgi:hypothetical protein
MESDESKLERFIMNKKQVKYKHIVLLESRRERCLSELADGQSLCHEALRRRRTERPITMISQHLGSALDTEQSSSQLLTAENPAPLPGRRSLVEDLNVSLPPYARRRWRGWIVSYFSVKRAQRIIPMKSTSFRLRCRNLSYKRRWNLGWC